MNAQLPIVAPNAGRIHGHPLDHTAAHRLCDGLTIFTPTAAQIAALVDRARIDLPVRLADNHVIQRVAAANPDSFWAIARKRSAEETATPRGLIALLMLNAAGVDALLTGVLDTRNPPQEFLVGQHQRPAAIYGWLIHTTGTLAPGLALVMEKLQAPLYRGVDIFCRAATDDGAAFFDALSFSRGTWWKGVYRADFRHYRRSFEGAGPNPLDGLLQAPFDDLGLPHVADAAPTVRASVVHSLDEMLKVFAIRSAVYVEEEACPYEEEFDSNDFAGTHLLGAFGDQPAGCVRIRYFADFAKIERLAVIKRFRGRGLGRKLVSAAIELCRTKGYGRAYAHARRSLLPFWQVQGFAPLPGARPFTFSDFEYVEVIRALDPFPAALTLSVGPYVLIRPEGQWDRPGILELSAQRNAA